MSQTEAERLARRAAARAHLSKNGFQHDIDFARLAEAIENLSMAVAELAREGGPHDAPRPAPGATRNEAP